MAMHDISSTAKNHFVCIGQSFTGVVSTSVSDASHWLHFRPFYVISYIWLAMLLTSSAIAQDKDSGTPKHTQWQALSDERAKTDGEVLLVRQNKASWLAQGAKPRRRAHPTLR